MMPRFELEYQPSKSPISLGFINLITNGLIFSPIKYNWLGGVQLAQNKAALRSYVVTKAEYEEHGGIWTARKFAGLEEPKNDNKRRKVEA